MVKKTRISASWATCRKRSSTNPKEAQPVALANPMSIPDGITEYNYGVLAITEINNGSFGE